MSSDKANRNTALKLVCVAAGMFGFGWALIPLYDLICEVTGLGGDPGGQYTVDPAVTVVDTSRLVKVNFIVNTNGGMPWRFWADKGGIRVHPGQLTEATFYVKNTTGRRMVGQAVPSVVPMRAAAYFHKTECFCFDSQVLEPGEELAMPMRFIVDAGLPVNVETISLSYALFDVTDAYATEAMDAGQDEAAVQRLDVRAESGAAR